MPKDENAYPKRTSAMQPHGNVSKRACRVVGPRRRRGRNKIESIRLKIEHINDKNVQKVETTYLERARAMQPRGNPSIHACEVHRPRHRRGRIKIKPIKVNPAQEDEKTYQEHIRTAQPPINSSKCLYGVVGPWRRRGRIKSIPRNVNQTRMDGNTYHGHVHAIRSIQRPKKSIIRLNKLTFRSRMPGEK